MQVLTDPEADSRTASVPCRSLFSRVVQLGNWGWRVGESGAFDKMNDEAAFLRKLLAYYNRSPDLEEAKEEVKSDKTEILEEKDGILQVTA